MLPEFDLLMPQALPEALEMLAEGVPQAVPLAGGTNLIVDMRSGRHRPSVLINIAGLDELRGIRREDGHVVVGGGMTITELMADPLIVEHGAPLKNAAAVLASPLIRNRATVAGNLVDASPAADTVPPTRARPARRCSVEVYSSPSGRAICSAAPMAFTNSRARVGSTTLDPRATGSAATACWAARRRLMKPQK